MSGAEAARMCLIWRNVPAERLAGEVTALEDRFRGLFAAALRLQARSIPAMADAQEGLRSFIEKRAPAWSHR